MNSSVFASLAILAGLGINEAAAECNISDAKLEEAILQKPELRGPNNRRRCVTCGRCGMLPLSYGPMGCMMTASVP